MRKLANKDPAAQNVHATIPQDKVIPENGRCTRPKRCDFCSRSLQIASLEIVGQSSPNVPVCDRIANIVLTGSGTGSQRERAQRLLGQHIRRRHPGERSATKPFASPGFVRVAPQPHPHQPTLGVAGTQQAATTNHLRGASEEGPTQDWDWVRYLGPRRGRRRGREGRRGKWCNCKLTGPRRPDCAPQRHR